MAFYLKFDGPLKHLDTDFVIVSQTGKEIPCHKFVLAMKSPVFDAMFDMKDSKEVVESRIEIPNISDEALQAMVTSWIPNWTTKRIHHYMTTVARQRMTMTRVST